MWSIIPITSANNRKFSTKVPIDKTNKVLQFETQYNELAGYWLVTISDSSGNNLISCLPVVPAQNILEQYAYLGIGSAYIVPAQTAKEQWPSVDTLGSDWLLVWGDTDG